MILQLMFTQYIFDRRKVSFSPHVPTFSSMVGRYDLQGHLPPDFLGVKKGEAFFRPHLWTRRPSKRTDSCKVTRQGPSEALRPWLDRRLGKRPESNLSPNLLKPRLIAFRVHES
jgi:hypothetical protein